MMIFKQIKQVRHDIEETTLAVEITELSALE